MNGYGHRAHQFSWTFLVLALLFQTAGTALAQAEPGSALPDSADNFTGTILFIFGRPQNALPVDVAELRATCVSRLEAALRGRGHRTADRDVIEEQVRKWRVRGSDLISPEFLRELGQEADVGQILVATLLTDNARFLLTTRLIDTASGRLTFVDLIDVDLPEYDPEFAPVGVPEWRRVLDAACQKVVPQWAPPPVPAEETLMVLPTIGIASDPAITSAAAHSLFKTLLGQGLVFLDPSLAEVTMIEAGMPSHWLAPRGRRLLQDRFGAKRILVSELVSYDQNSPMVSLQALDPDEPATIRWILTEFSMSMRTVDLRTGTALRSATILHDKPPATGWFGNPVRTTLLQELEATSQALWAAFSPDSEDN